MGGLEVMVSRNYNKIIEDICQSVDCRKPLTTYETQRQKLLPRSFKYRFCRKCRQIPDHCNSAVRWRCRLCPQIMCASDTLRGRYYCGPCAEVEGKRRSKLKANRSPNILCSVGEWI